MAKKPVRTFTNKMNSRKKSVILLVTGFVLFGAVVGLATAGVMQYFAPKTVYRHVTIQTTDGLMGLVGEAISLGKGDLAVYRTTYTNNSSNDLFITIKATQREHDLSQKWCSGAYCDLGAWNGSTYSDKKLVKKGETTEFTVPVTPLGNTSTGYVELEAFKTIQD